MKIAGVDPSLTRTAVATSSVDLAGHPIVRVCGTKAAGMEVTDRIRRYEHLADQTIELIDGATIVMLEAYSYGSQGRGVIDLGEYGGLLRYKLIKADVEIVEVPPTNLKKFVAGKGSVKKPEFVGAMTKRWGVVFPGEDEYFAFGLYQMGLVYCRRAKAATAYQLEAVNTLRGK